MLQAHLLYGRQDSRKDTIPYQWLGLGRRQRLQDLIVSSIVTTRVFCRADAI